MTIREFLDKFLDASEKDAEERCGVKLDLKKAASQRKELMAPFLQPNRKQLLSVLSIREEITPAELVAAYAETLSSREGLIMVHLDIDEFNQGGILQSAALGIVTIYWSLAIDSPQDPRRMTQETPSLSANIDVVIRFKAVLEKDSDGKHKINPDDARKLREALSTSLVDADAVIHWLENPKQPGQYV